MPLLDKCIEAGATYSSKRHDGPNVKWSEYSTQVWALQGEDRARQSKGGIYGRKNGALLSKEVGGGEMGSVIE